MPTHILRAVSRCLGLAVACSLSIAPPAWAAFGAHYEGRSRDGQTYRLYLDGGAYLGRSADMQSLRITVRRERQGVLTPVSTACTYFWSGHDPLKNRIECAAAPRSPLAGAAYARERSNGSAGAGGDEVLVCVRGCGARVPGRLVLEDADEDNH
jgi:hypothetical protein